ncbi:unnamed protein product [Ectocarpus sp. 4 AP-2014]
MQTAEGSRFTKSAHQGGAPQKRQSQTQHKTKTTNGPKNEKNTRVSPSQSPSPRENSKFVVCRHYSTACSLLCHGSSVGCLHGSFAIQCRAPGAICTLFDSSHVHALEHGLNNYL